MARRFIESEDFPAEIVSFASAPEKGPGRPPFWEMVFWWTRKPLAGARAVVAGSILPDSVSVDDFLRMIYPNLHRGICSRGEKGYLGYCFKGTPHRFNPVIREEYRRLFQDSSLLDPFAGYGSIPLEALRLGVGNVVAVELLPTAVIFLRAILEYPLRAARDKAWRNLVKDVEEAGRRVIEELRKDPDIRELYDEDTAVYIGTWEIKCPYCGKYTPAIGNWWLARVKKGDKYVKLAYMKPIPRNDRVEIEVVDLTGKAHNAEPIISGGKTIGVKIQDQKYIIGDPQLNGKPNIDAKKQELTCLHCHAKIKGKHREWHVKKALKQWNTNFEKYLNGEISLEELKNSPARPRLLVKVKIRNGNLEFQPTTREDDEKLWKALEKLKQLWEDPDIPTEELWKYTSGTAGNLSIITWGFEKFYKLSNPRQLLTLVKLVKLIREAGKRVEGEKLREGWSKENASKYAEAITIYLAITLCKHADYNSVVTAWNPGFWGVTKVQHTLAVRGIAMQWNWSEVNPYNANNPLSFISIVEEYIIDSMSYLVYGVSGSSSRVRVRLDDATVISEPGDERFDVIVTDPPYRDDVPYAELSDFYFVWLKRALSDVVDGGLVPRFHGDVLFDEFGSPISTQWERFSISEVDFNPGRLEYFGVLKKGVDPERVYWDLLGRSFESMVRVLKSDGLLVTYFAHSSPEAWAALVYAGRRAGLYVTNAFPLLTESLQSVVSRGKEAITSSIVVVWRRRSGSGNGVLDLSRRENELVEKVRDYLRRFHSSRLRQSEITGYIMSYARTIGLLMSYDRVKRGEKELDVKGIVREASRITANAYAAESGTRLVSDEAVFYYLVKQVIPIRGKGVRRIASSSDLLLLAYGFTREEQGSGKTSREGLKRFIGRIIAPTGRRDRATSVASRKLYYVIEPRGSDEASVAEVLSIKGIDASRIDKVPPGRINSVDLLHVLEYYSFRPRSVFHRVFEDLSIRFGDKINEAVELAQALSRIMGDPEAVLAKRVLEYLDRSTGTSRKGGLDEWFT